MILDAAYALFAEVGYERATMRTLAERVGVGVGTIFQHFPDKPSLLVAAYLEDMGEFTRDAFASMPKTDIRDQLLHITRRLYSFYAKNPRVSRTLFKEALFLTGEHGRVLDGQLDAFLSSIADLISHAVEKEELPAGTDPILSAQAYGSFYLSALVMGLKSPEFDADAQVRLVKKLLDTWFSGKKRCV